MATTTKGRATSPAAKKKPTRAIPKAPTRTRKPSTPAPKARPGLLTRAGRSCSAALGRQADDVWGVLLVVAGALAGLGIYLGLAGPAGQAMKSSTGDVMGWSRLLVTPALVLTGITLIRGVTRQVFGRVALGCLGMFVATSGILHLSRGPANWSIGQPGLAGLADAGGLVGAMVGAPLRQFLAPWGAGLVLATVLAVSLLIMTGTPVRLAGQRAG
ncbi:MAG: segregation ATPase FtsK/SpoIIIE, family, partial [Acidimicrobiaceae bacterium]|nr:segregation ATPase FtsK/SpoIIIE, family [Acidimicrobiaceae bacterium]